MCVCVASVTLLCDSCGNCVCVHLCPPTTAYPQHGQHPGPSEMWAPPQPSPAPGPLQVSPLSAGAQQRLLRGCGSPWRARLGAWGPQTNAPQALGSLWGVGAHPAVLPRVGVMGGSQGTPSALHVSVPPCPIACPCDTSPSPPISVPTVSPSPRAPHRAEQTMSGVSTCWGHCQGDTGGTQVTLGHWGRTINNHPPRSCWG